ncbi:MAG TPA: hypothetical protein VNA69_24075 [Thermoanaerobaculia bacterium]|nr:hypothetical protein [Thermoanaerobaculia bacterium]
MPKEPQSYGSQKDWVTGEVGSTVNRQKRKPAPEHRDFYDESPSSETSAPDEGGQVSDVQLAENIEPAGPRTPDDQQPIAKVTDQKSGAKRGGYFKDRDY